MCVRVPAMPPFGNGKLATARAGVPLATTEYRGYDAHRKPAAPSLMAGVERVWWHSSVTLDMLAAAAPLLKKVQNTDATFIAIEQLVPNAPDRARASQDHAGNVGPNTNR